MSHIFSDMHIWGHEALLCMLVVVSIAIISVRDLLSSAILFGIFSFLMASAYLVYEAPDVAITEAAVGAGISTLVFLMTLVFTGRDNIGPSRHYRRWAAFVVVSMVGVALVLATSEMALYGDVNSPVQTHVNPYYIEYTKQDIAIPNIVTAILASYRAWDTFGEVGVTLMALLAVFLLLGRDDDASSEEGGDHA